MYKKRQIDKKQALSKVQYICSKQEKCCYDIRKKLREWNISSTDQDEIIDSLLDDKFIDENRYTPLFVRDKFRFNKWGRIKITHHLKQKQIASRIISEALEQIDEQEYYEVLSDLLNAKIKSVKEEDPYQLKAKLLRFAQGRGFENQLSISIIDNIISNNN
jgi:regulatory protein